MDKNNLTYFDDENKTYRCIKCESSISNINNIIKHQKTKKCNDIYNYKINSDNNLLQLIDNTQSSAIPDNSTTHNLSKYDNKMEMYRCIKCNKVLKNNIENDILKHQKTQWCINRHKQIQPIVKGLQLLNFMMG
uniref:C2H2-type domain-containing protein n=1 Tax=viral metagenome TaxID=1070528 RepID=A0A6C0H9B6_9ZZZZ